MRKILILLAKLRYCWNSSRLKELHLVSLVGIMIVPTFLSNTFKLNVFLYSVYLLLFPEFASFVVSSPKDDCHDYHEEKRHHWNILDQHKFTIALKQK